jgi:hypothetical protein
MLTAEQKKTVAGMTRIMQIIIVALAAGVASYLTFAILNRDPEGEAGHLALGGLAMAAGMATVAVILPAYLAAQQRSRIAAGVEPKPRHVVAGDDATLLLVGLQTQKIIRAALLEGAAFFNIFVYQSGGPAYSLGISSALLLAIVVLFPVRRLVEEWLERELKSVNELRQLQR